MWKCPVCDTKNQQLQCTCCGFDGSCDFERYPTLQKLPAPAESINQKRIMLQPEPHNIRCPKCGDTHFSLNQAFQYTCLSCNHCFSAVDAIESSSQEAVFSGTAPVPVFRNRARTKWEIWILRLGIACMPLYPLILLISCFEHRFLVLVILAIIQLLMQLHLRKKGFACSNRMKQIWQYPDRFDVTKPSASVKNLAALLLMLPRICFDSFAYVLSGMVIRGPVYILIFLGYLSVFVPMSSFGFAGGFIITLSLIEIKLLFLYCALWLHGHIRAMKN